MIHGHESDNRQNKFENEIFIFNNFNNYLNKNRSHVKLFVFNLFFNNKIYKGKLLNLIFTYILSSCFFTKYFLLLKNYLCIHAVQRHKNC